MPSNRSKRLAAKRAREQEAMEEHDQETETEQQTGEQDGHGNDSTAEAKRTGIKTTAPLIKGNPAKKSACYMVKFLDEAVHYLCSEQAFQQQQRALRKACTKRKRALYRPPGVRRRLLHNGQLPPAHRRPSGQNKKGLRWKTR